MKNKVNPLYLSTETQQHISNHFNAQTPKSIQLPQFFTETFYAKLVAAIHSARFVEDTDLLSHSYAKTVPLHPLEKFLNETMFLTFLSFVIKKPVRQIHSETFRFSWKDYTILHDEHLEQPGVDVVIDFTPTWDTAMGGSLIYSTPTHPLILPPSANVVSIVERTNDVHRFVQYLNHYCEKKKRYFVLGRIE